MRKIQNYLSSTSKIKKISDAFFLIALIISLSTLWSTYTAKASNVCPINANQNMYYLSIGLLIISFVITFFEKKRN